tara:strand:- start:11257 stop:11385 length:129 start_codon:yes stop_codon:yes gene_type:complete
LAASICAHVKGRLFAGNAFCGIEAVAEKIRTEMEKDNTLGKT